jgi:hypothetical protein
MAKTLSHGGPELCDAERMSLDPSKTKGLAELAPPLSLITGHR